MKIGIRFAREGWPFIAIAGGIALVAELLIPWPWAVFPWLLVVGVAAFFRDPDRVPPEGSDWVVAPADGTVLEVVTDRAPGLDDLPMTRVSIFMSVANVHVNRAPMAGDVAETVHHPGRFLPAYREKASLENEQGWLLLETAAGPVFLKQIAGLVARRVVCRVRPGDRLSMGQRFGLIRFGSRVDVFLPGSIQVLARPGQRTLAGETIIGRVGEQG